MDSLGKRIWGCTESFVEGGEVLGRKVANEEFIKAFLEENPFDAYHFFLSSPAEMNRMELWLNSHFPSLEAQGKFKIFPRTVLAEAFNKNKYFCFHLSDCLERQVALQRARNYFSPNIFPITGLTHSLSYARFMPDFFSHLWEGSSSRDSIICSSKAAHEVLNSIFTDLKTAYAMNISAPRMDLIPLGVRDKPLAGKADISAMKKKIRAKLKLEAEDKMPLLYLCLGRISSHSKMDILPLFQAFKKALAEGLNKNEMLFILSGWADEKDPLPNALESFAKQQGIPFMIIPRPTDEERDALYEISDVFISPADNLQESFGLTIIEAQRAGLPVIATDFNGYKDTVLRDKAGFLIPTLGFTSSLEENNLSSFWFDNQYHMQLAQKIAFDIPSMGKAIYRLGSDASLTAEMGKKAKKNFKAKYTWSGVIREYCQLWEELNKVDISPEEEEKIRKPHPLTMNFARAFKGHFSHTLASPALQDKEICRTELGGAFYQGAIRDFPYAGLDLMLDRNILRKVLFQARKKSTLKVFMKKLESLEKTPEGKNLYSQEKLESHILWLLKHGYLELNL